MTYFKFEKALAEYIIDIAKQSASEKEFLKKLEEDEALFSVQFSSNLYILIQKMLPEALKTKSSGKKGDSEGDPKFAKSGVYVEPEHLTFEEKEMLEGADKKILAAKYDLN